MANIFDRLRLMLIVIIFTVISTNTGLACTRILETKFSQAIMVGRNMDWLEDMHTRLLVYPEAITHEGKTSVNPFKWTSKYGSGEISVTRASFETK